MLHEEQRVNKHAAALRGASIGCSTHLVAQIEQLVEVHAPEGKLLEGALLAHLHHLLRAQCFVRHDAAAAEALRHNFFRPVNFWDVDNTPNNSTLQQQQQTTMPPKRAAAAGGAPQPPGAGGEAFPPPVPAFSALTLSGNTVLLLQLLLLLCIRSYLKHGSRCCSEISASINTSLHLTFLRTPDQWLREPRSSELAGFVQQALSRKAINCIC
jgi:hypothetical protein